MNKLFILIPLLLSSTVSIASNSIEDEIKQLVIKNLKYTQNENLEKVMSTVHTESPNYLPTKNAMPNIFQNYNLNYKLLSYKFIAHDGDLAYARIIQSTKKVTGLAFNNNEIDAVQAFRKESGVWKLWAQMNIAVKFVK